MRPETGRFSGSATGFSYEGMKIGDVFILDFTNFQLEQTINTLPIQPFLFDGIILQGFSEFTPFSLWTKSKPALYGKLIKKTDFSRYASSNYRFNVLFPNNTQTKLYFYSGFWFGEININIDDMIFVNNIQNQIQKKIYTNSRRKRYNSIFVNFY